VARDDHSWIGEKYKEVFKAIFLSYKASYTDRFSELFEGKIIQVDTYQIKDIEIDDDSLFFSLTTAFRNHRPNKDLASNFNDVAALMYLAKRVAAYNNDNSQPLPVYYDSHNYAEYLTSEILNRYFTLITHTEDGNGELRTSALRSHDFFMLYALFYYKDQEVISEELTYEHFIKEGQSTTDLEKLVTSSPDVTLPEVSTWYKQENQELKEKILNYVQVDFYKVLFENVSQSRLEVINTILQDFHKKELNEQDTETLAKRNEIILRYLNDEITGLLQETVTTYTEIQSKVRQVGKVAELLRDHNQELDVLYHYSLARFFLPKTAQASIRHFFSKDGIIGDEYWNISLGTLWNYYCRTVYYRQHPHVASKQLLDINSQYILYGSFWVLGLEDKLFDFNIQPEHLEELDHSLLMLIGATIHQAIILPTGDSKKQDHYSTLYAEIIRILERRLATGRLNQEQQAQIHIVLAYLCFQRWFQEGNKGWLSRSEEERSFLVYDEQSTNYKAINFAKQAYYFYKNQSQKNNASYLYTLNIYIYYVVEAAPNEEFRKIGLLKEEFTILKGSRDWHFRYDDTLARIFHRMATLVPHNEQMVFFNQAIEILSESLSSVRALQGKEVQKLRAYLNTLVIIKGELMMSIAESSYEPIRHVKTKTHSTLIGRKKQIEEILECIRRPTPVTAIVGLPGVGKTSLALEIAHLSKGQSDLAINNALSFEYVVWISMNDYAPEQNILNHIFDEIGRATGYVKITQISEKELVRKESEINAILKMKSTLLILDNYEANSSVNLERWIQTIMPPSEVLLTTLRNPNFPHNNYRLDKLTDEEAIEFIQKQADLQGLNLNEFGEGNNLQGLIRISGATPQAIIIALGMIRQKALRPEDLDGAREPGEFVYDKLYATSWEVLKEPAKQLLSLFLIFNSQSALHRDALFKASRLNQIDFNTALRELCDWNLLSSDLANEHYAAHPTLIGFLDKRRARLFNSERIKCVHIDFIAYYLDFLKRTIVRQTPEEPYWNALVSDQMNAIESDWPAIKQAIDWCGQHEETKEALLEFATLLIHYMDSRFYNRERLNLVSQAIMICQKASNYTMEALLKIDALSWTFVEENDATAANLAIVEGYRIVIRHITDVEDRSYLKALSAAWLARTKAEHEEAGQQIDRLIQKALVYTTYRNRKPWITFRIYMAAGDIAFKRKSHKEALAYYQKAKKETNLYGGEGNDYQINPRLGLAYLSTGRLDWAEKLFTTVRDKHEISIGKLYGEYGLAMVVYERGEREEANMRMKKVKEEIIKRSESNLLLNLILQYEALQKKEPWFPSVRFYISDN
jgi:GTPase SAR1 family protein